MPLCVRLLQDQLTGYLYDINNNVNIHLKVIAPELSDNTLGELLFDKNTA